MRAGAGVDAIHLGGATERAAPVLAATAAINGLGFSPHQTWAFWRAESSGMVETPFRCPNGERATMVTVRTLPPRSHGVARLKAMTLEALDQMAPLLARSGPQARIGLALGIAERFGVAASRSAERQRLELESAIKRWFHERGLELRAYAALAEGHASLAAASAQAATALSAGVLDLAIVGGVDSSYDPQVVADLIARERLFDLENPDAMIPGEGAALLLLTAPATARHLGLPRSVELQSAASADEPGARYAPIPCQGTGLAAAMRAVSDRLAAERRRVDWLLGDVSNESYRSRELSLAFPRAFARRAASTTAGAATSRWPPRTCAPSSCPRASATWALPLWPPPRPSRRRRSSAETPLPRPASYSAPPKAPAGAPSCSPTAAHAKREKLSGFEGQFQESFESAHGTSRECSA
jgi:3-oxoacyl-[acyl-carrier-protein] synthase-1